MIEYHILREIESNSLHTQRTLARQLGVSLGKVHYLLSELIQKGCVEAKKLKSHYRSIRWQYYLTAAGIQMKCTLAKDYLKRRKKEYADLKNEISFLEQEVALVMKEKQIR